MNGVDRLPKHVAEQKNEVPVPAHWVKRVSPPRRFLLVFLLSAQILFLAVVRLGPSASIWGASRASPPQALSYTASFSVGSEAGLPRTNKEFHVEEKEALSSSPDVTAFPDDQSSSSTLSLISLSASSSPSSSLSASKKKGRNKKKSSSKSKAGLKKPLKPKQEKAVQSQRESSSVHPLKLQESPDEAANVAAQRADQSSPAIVDTIDDLLPSIDDKLLAQPASQGAASTTIEAKVDGSGPTSSASDSHLSFLDKQGGPEETVVQPGEFQVEVSTEISSSSNNDGHVENHEEGAQEEAKFSEPLVEFSVEIPREEVTSISSKTEDRSQQIEKAGNVKKKEEGTQEDAIPAQLGEELSVEVSDGRVTKSGEHKHLESVESDVGSEETQRELEQALPAEKVIETSKVDDEQKEEQATGPQKETEALPINNSENVEDRSSLPIELPLNELSVQEETSTSSHCKYGYIYVYDLPSAFNRDVISNCSALNPWLDACSTLLNGGLGESLGEASPLGQVGSWFVSDQFTAEIVFHNRILQHPCLTDKVEHALGFYVPFYAGLDVGRFLWLGTSADRRDRVSNQLLQWLSEQPSWKASGGWNHFMMVGRITWDFRRSKDEDWGSGFFYKPAMHNMTKLLIERNPWDDQEVAVPYPTNFHPQSDSDMVAWQNHIRSAKRNVLFSFAGAPRKRFSDDFRGILLEQCGQAQSCQALDCSNQTCDRNQKTLDLFLNSTFCLQPRGDSFTRRSTFDCLLAGSIPVFFWHRSAYMQYKWHLPANEASYSVFISRDEVRNGTKIEDILNALSLEKVQAMQEAVVRLVPRILYAASGFSLKEEKDAFDVAIEAVMRKFKGISMRVER